MQTRCFTIVAVGSMLVTAASVARGGGDGGRDFDRQVAPLLARRCLDCHSGADPKGALNLSRRASAFEGGKSGAPIVPGKPEDSLLWERVDGR